MTIVQASYKTKKLLTNSKVLYVKAVCMIACIIIASENYCKLANELINS
jgi:hypothetical protein